MVDYAKKKSTRFQNIIELVTTLVITYLQFIVFKHSFDLLEVKQGLISSIRSFVHMSFQRGNCGFRKFKKKKKISELSVDTA